MHFLRNPPTPQKAVFSAFFAFEKPVRTRVTMMTKKLKTYVRPKAEARHRDKGNSFRRLGPIGWLFPPPAPTTGNKGPCARTAGRDALYRGLPQNKSADPLHTCFGWEGQRPDN